MRILTAACLALFLALGAAQAATAAEPDTVDGVKAAPLEDPVAPDNGLQIVSEDGKPVIVARFTWDIDGLDDEDTQKPEGVLTSLSFLASAPLDKGDGDTASKNLDALAKATTVTFGLTRTSFSRAPSLDREAMQALCDEAAGLARAAGKSFDESGRCSLSWVVSTAPAKDGERLGRAYQRLLVGESPMADTWGINGRVGSDSFEYIDPATLAKRSVDKTGWSAKVYYAFLPLDQPLLVRFEVEHQDAYEARKEATVCPPGGPPCLTGAVGAPTHIRKDIVTLDVRRQFKAFALSAALSYDTSNDVYGIEAPIYFQRDKDGAFNGGVKLNWRSDEGGVTAAVFVGTTFSLGF